MIRDASRSLLLKRSISEVCGSVETLFSVLAGYSRTSDSDLAQCLSRDLVARPRASHQGIACTPAQCLGVPGLRALGDGSLQELSGQIRTRFQ